MRGWIRITILLCATNLLIPAVPARHAFAADSATLSQTPASQWSSNSLRPSAGRQVVLPRYRMEQGAQEPESPGLRQYLASSEEISLLGMSLRRDERKAGQEIQGLLIVDVAPGSPAANAGLHSFRQPARDVVNAASMLATMIFPPAVVVGAIAGSLPLGEDYDLIIGVDGSRVTNFVNFYECMRDVRPGEIVYLNILHNGLRMQIPLRVTTPVPSAESWVR